MARTSAAELEVGLTYNLGHGIGPSVAAYPGKLAGGEPGSIVPEPRLEPGVEVGKLALEAGLSGAGHAVAL